MSNIKLEDLKEGMLVKLKTEEQLLETGCDSEYSIYYHEESNCGVCDDSDDVEAFASVLKDFILNEEKYSNCGNNGRSYFIQNFTKEKFMKDIETIFNK